MSEHNNAKYFTRGGQIIFHNLRMLFQINKTVGKIYLFSLLLLTALVTYLMTPHEVVMAASYWCYAQASSLLSLLGVKIHGFSIPYHGTVYYETPKDFLAQWQFVNNAHAIFHYLLMGFVIAFVLSIVIAFFMVKWLTWQGKKCTENRFIRGMLFEDSKKVAKLIEKEKKVSPIKINGFFPMIINFETLHTLFHGTTGSGKSQLMMNFLDYLRDLGIKVIIYDKGCSYTSIYYHEGKDHILNPFDERCENWDLWSEALDAPHFENMAESLIPMHGETDPFWVNAARTIFASAAYTMQDDPDRSIDQLLQLLLTSKLNELEKYLEGTEAATLASDKIEKTAISIRSVITTYLKSLRFLTGLNKPEKKKFSIRDWIHDEKDTGWLFISCNEEQHIALQPLISMWVAMASTTLLSLSEDRKRRIYFMVDELTSLHKIPQLPGTLAEARKFGGCFFIGMQSYAQIEKVYGRNAAREIFDLLNTRFFFRSPSADMAKLVSSELGEQEVEDMRENYSYGANKIRDGISIGSQRMTRPIVVYPDIMKLEDMNCYLRLPGDFPVTLLNLKRQERKMIEAGFIQRDIKINPELEEGIKKSEGKSIDEIVAKKITESEEMEQQHSKETPTSGREAPSTKNKLFQEEQEILIEN